MDIFAFPPIAALLNGAYIAVEAFITLITPFAGALSAAIAIVVLTMLARTLLIPVGRSQMKAEWARRRTQPKLAALQQRYRKNPQLLREKTAALYKAENVSPFAGFLPALAQLPVISLVYALFIRVTIDGHANALLGQHLFGASLGTSFVAALGTGNVTSIVVSLVLFALIGVTAWLARRVNVRNALPATSVTAARTASVLSWLPFITVGFAAFVPLAAALYLTVTTAWTLVERSLLRRRFWVSGRPDHPEQQDADGLKRKGNRERNAAAARRAGQGRVAEQQ